MEISIEEIGRESEEKIIIRCHEVNDVILKLLSKLKTEKSVVLGYDECNIHRLRISDVYYFEAVDNKVFESKQKLYKLEETCQRKKFFRASKSTIINMTKVLLVRPSLSGRKV